MRLFTIILLLCVTITLQAQTEFKLDYCDCIDTIENMDTSPDGEFKRHCDGKLIIKGEFVNGQKDGPWLTYSLNGTLIRTFHYEKGTLTGNVEMFYSNGNAKLKGKFEQGRKVGLWEYYSDKGKLLKTGSFEQGKPVGEWTVYGIKGKKPKVSYDFSKQEYIKKDKAPFIFEKAAIVQNDNSHKWYIRQESADSKDDSNTYPFEGYALAREMHSIIMEIPMDFWETYISQNYVGEILLQNGGMESVEISLTKKHSEKGGEIGFFAITNDRDKLHQVAHNPLSLALLAYNVKEALWMTGPWISSTDKISVYTPFVINQFKNRKD